MLAQLPSSFLASLTPADIADPDREVRSRDAKPAVPGAAQLNPVVVAALRDADQHYVAGRAYAIEGQADKARAEFDGALEVLFQVPADAPDRSYAERRFEELIRRIHRYDIERMGAGQSPEIPVFVPSPLPEILDLTFPMEPSLKDKTVEKVRALKSQLPLTVNDSVLTYINFFSSPRGSKILMYGLKRAGRYRPMISRILDEEGVPQELLHLAQAESAFAPRAVSHKAATGMWQFVQWRGREYGLVQSQQSDDRLDPEKATRAAARHLRDLYEQFGDWYLAMAAYNCGPGCVDRAVQRTGYADFWELRRRNAIPRETTNYVPAIVAMAIMSKDLGAYGLQPPVSDPEMEFDTVRVDQDTSLALLADAVDRPTSDLVDLNPSFLRGVVPAATDVRVPRGSAARVLSVLPTVPAEKRTAWRVHHVASGDTLAAIAKRYSTPANSIMAANTRFDSTFFNSPESGETLLIPASARPEPVLKAKAKPGRNRSRQVLTAKSGNRTTKAKPAPQRVARVSARTRSINR